MSSVERPARIEFFFDVMCPYAYQSSKWIRTVRSATGLEVEWRFFSLEEINRVEGKKHPWERPWSFGWSQMRIGALLRRSAMADLDRWYATVGEAFHEHARPTQDPAVHRAVLAEAGFDPALLDAAIADPTTADDVKADHLEAVGSYGAFGVPTLVFPTGDTRTAVYQQLVPAPDDPDDAVALFDLLIQANRFPGLYELKHPKRPGDIRIVADTFAPYLQARTWNTIENPAP